MTAQAGKPLIVLGIESSCDDTAAAVVVVHPERGAPPLVLSSVVVGQDAAHAPYGGVVPEIAARAHAVRLDGVVADAMREAGKDFRDLDMVAATAGPGLIGGVMSGFSFAKGLAMALDRPLVPVNHLVGHALSVGLSEEVAFPYLLLLVSGGHTQLLVAEGPSRFRRLGTTIDDAAGEAFDKTAKLLGLDGAGGPAIQSLAGAPGADPDRFELPRPLLQRPGCDFSFSGMKTAVRELAEKFRPLTEDQRRDIAASFQAAAVAHLVARTDRAITALIDEGWHSATLVAAGGVAANASLREALWGLAARVGWTLIVPPFRFCTDNAAMIAYAGALQFMETAGAVAHGALEMAPRARWPLDPENEDGTVGTGRKGRKV